MNLLNQRKTENQNMFRRNVIAGFFGINKTGKSSVMLEVMKQFLKQNKHKKIIAFDIQKNFTSIKSTEIKITDDWLQVINNTSNSLIILDEVNLLMPPLKKFPDDMQKILTQSFFRNNDIIYSAHNPAIVNKVFPMFTSHYYIFKLYATKDNFKQKIPAFYLCQKASEKVNNYVKENGFGLHPSHKDYKKGKGFPHAIVFANEEKIIYQNILS